MRILEAVKRGLAPLRPVLKTSLSWIGNNLKKLPPYRRFIRWRRLREGLRFYRERDAEENAEITPPDNERIQLHCLWLVDFFPPARRRALVEALQYFPSDTPFLRPSNEPWLWAETARSGLHYGGRLSLKPIYPEGTRPLWGAHSARLPEGVADVQVHIYNLVPSHTAVVVQFRFESSVRTSLESVLRSQYSTTVKRHRHGAVYLSPAHKQRDAVAELRRELRRRCALWMSQFFPGLFSSSEELRDRIPSCDFLTLRAASPFPEVQAPKYLMSLNLHMLPDAWTSPALEGLFLSTERSSNDPRLTISGNEHRIFNDDAQEAYGGHTSRGFCARADAQLKDVIVRWALTSVLDVYVQSLTRMRDSARPRLNPTPEAESLLDLRAGALPFVHDVKKVATNESYFVSAVPTFSPADPRFGSTNLLEWTRQNLVNSAELLGDLLRDIGETVLTHSTLSASRSTNRLTGCIFILTGVLVILTLVLVYLTWLLGR